MLIAEKYLSVKDDRARDHTPCACVVAAVWYSVSMSEPERV